MDELIVHVSEKTYAYGAIRAENQDLLSTISELKTRLEKVEKEGKNIIALKWLWKNKCDAENIVVQNKTRLVAKGYKQEEGIDFEESFAPLPS
ncbi:retrovirus-related pol polyprotein from transposon TNT 1-94 [Tanacetum coccineum]